MGATVNSFDGDNLNRLCGAQRAEALFGERQLDRVVCPFPRARVPKRAPGQAQSITADMVRGPVVLSEVDPRELWGSQGYVLRQHVEYYFGDRWALTAITSADRCKEANHFPTTPWRWPCTTTSCPRRPIGGRPFGPAGQS
jgi:hypothetical protein